MAFDGFSDDLIGFLADLSENNDREWFKAHQGRYERSVREPARAFVRHMGPLLADVAPYLVADDRKVGGSIMRPQRDTRFSGDKRPYKTNLGIQFRHAGGKDVHAPGLYVHVAPDEVFVGLGMWRPESATLKAIRDRIVEEPESWKRVAHGKDVVSHWRQGGQDEALKGPPRGYPKDHALLDDLRLKSHILIHEPDRDALLAPDFDALLLDLTRRAAPYCGFLCGATGEPW